MQHYDINDKNIHITANKIAIGEDVIMGQNIIIKCNGTFSIGDYSNLGSDVEISGNNVIIGKHFFHSKGLRVGGGGRMHPNANLTIGDRCTVHNNFINVCEPVVIGNDVGLSPNSDIITHGYWLSVLEGYPAKFKGVKIHNGVIVGYRSTILMGVEIAENVIIGAGSVVTRSIKIPNCICTGNPCTIVKEIIPLLPSERITTMQHMIDAYLPVAKYHGFIPVIKLVYPYIDFLYKNKYFKINVETFEYWGAENQYTDDFRDYIRKYGIRVYTKRPFKPNFK